MINLVKKKKLCRGKKAVDKFIRSIPNEYLRIPNENNEKVFL